MPARVVPCPTDGEVPLVLSPDRRRAIDLSRADGAEPDSWVFLHDPVRATCYEIMVCGTPCRWDHATWLSERFAVVAGRVMVEYREPPSKTCTLRPDLYVFDVERRVQWRFQVPQYEGPCD